MVCLTAATELTPMSESLAEAFVVAVEGSIITTPCAMLINWLFQWVLGDCLGTVHKPRDRVREGKKSTAGKKMTPISLVFEPRASM